VAFQGSSGRSAGAPRSSARSTERRDLRSRDRRLVDGAAPAGRAAAGWPRPLGDRVYVFGGEAPLRIFNAHEMYEVAGNAWIGKDPMRTPRHGIGAGGRRQRIYVPAGGTQPGSPPPTSTRRTSRDRADRRLLLAVRRRCRRRRAPRGPTREEALAALGDTADAESRRAAPRRSPRPGHGRRAAAGRRAARHRPGRPRVRESAMWQVWSRSGDADVDRSSPAASSR
jgi:hypothetical protein